MTTATVQERLREALQRAAKRGGLPGFAELEKFRNAFLDLEEQLDDYAGDAVAVSDAYGDEVEVPFKIEAEHIAVLALLVEEMRSQLPDIERLLSRISGSLYGVDRVRATQGGDDA